MDCWGNISLVHNSSTALVTSMWYNVNPASDYQKHNSLSREAFNAWWEELENTLINNLKLLPIPQSTKKLLFNIAQPIGNEIQKWLEFHTFLDFSDIKLSDTLVWESPGTIDWKLTAEKTISNEKLCVLNKFRLACINCLDVVINQLWPEVRSYFYDADNERLNCEDVPEIMFWVCHLEDEVEEMMELMECSGRHEFIQSAAWSAVISNNAVAAKYFIEQLEPHDSARVVKNSVNYLIKKRLNCNSNLLAYLLSNLNKMDQSVLFITQSENILLHFLNWPLQNLFLELVDDLWKVLSPIAYYNILEEIIRKASEFHHGQIYSGIFEQFWEKASLRFKCYVVHKCINATFLSRLFSLKKTDAIVERIIKYSTADQRLQMLLDFNGRQTIDFLISKHRWNSLILFIEACVSNETNINELREAYSEHVNKSSYITISDVDIEQFNRILDNIYKSLTQKS